MLFRLYFGHIMTMTNDLRGTFHMSPRHLLSTPSEVMQLSSSTFDYVVSANLPCASKFKAGGPRIPLRWRLCQRSPFTARYFGSRQSTRAPRRCQRSSVAPGAAVAELAVAVWSGVEVFFVVVADGETPDSGAVLCGCVAASWISETLDFGRLFCCSKFLINAFAFVKLFNIFCNV